MPNQINPLQIKPERGDWVYVRYLGSGACWTLNLEGSAGAASYYMGEREELTDDERAVCDAGGGYVPATPTHYATCIS